MTAIGRRIDPFKSHSGEQRFDHSRVADILL